VNWPMPGVDREVGAILAKENWFKLGWRDERLYEKKRNWDE
jgi:hypothetical protein